MQVTSKYHQRMRKLSCKIFNEFYIPEIPRSDLNYGISHKPVAMWMSKWHSDLRVFERNQELPIDLDPSRNHKYYPAHPQYRALTHTLREYGLFRDEHRDFNEEMRKIAEKRGKVFRKPGGEAKKNKKK